MARGLTAVAVLAGLALPGTLRAEVPEPPDPTKLNMFGITGLIDMPTAEMQPDAQVSFTVGYFGGYNRNTLSVQLMPWLEGAFRYSILEKMDPGPEGPTLYDRSFDLKLRLIQEGPSWPAVVFGLQDFLGTGVYSGEYFAATKGFLDGDVKLTGGFGWGRFAGVNTMHNPLCYNLNRFCTRSGDFQVGGTANFGQYFSGEDIGIFGGIEWQTPIKRLTLKAEYSSDDYDEEEAIGSFRRDLPLNFGAEYRITDHIDLGAYYMYGSEVGLRLSLSGNPFRPLADVDGEAAPRPVISRPKPDPATEQALFGNVHAVIDDAPATASFGASGITGVEVETRTDGVRWATAELPVSAGYDCPDEEARAIDAEYGVIDAVTFRHPDGRLVCTVALRPAGQLAIRRSVRANAEYPTDWHSDEAKRREIVEQLVARLDADRLGLLGISLDPDRVTVYIENRKFRAMPRAIGRTARALTATMPASVELFEIVPVEGSLPTASVTLQRSELEDQVERPDAARVAWLMAKLSDAAPVDWGETEQAMAQFPRVTWSIDPVTPINLFDPHAPLRFDVSVAASAGLEVRPGLSLNGTVMKSGFGNLDQGKIESDSKLQHVRSDVARYQREGDPSIVRVTADYVTKLDEGLYGRLSAGLLERMFGGVSGELLWKPATQDWGIGAELNWVQQRDYDQLLTFQNYNVVTGHASFYWDTGWHGINAQIDAGRYLAGDWGGTLTLSRRFANGWQFGAFATFTNVPFSEFGEGSFDKGIFLTIPIGWLLPYETRSTYSMIIKPLFRDGGQRLWVANRLYPVVQDMDAGGLRENWGNFWE